MSWLKDWIGKPAAELRAQRTNTLRGKVSRNSVIKGGELSVVIRFGLEEAARVKDLLPGTLVSIQPEEPNEPST